MINSIVSALQLVLVLVSLALILYLILIKREDRISNYIMLLFNSCLLWAVLI